MSTVLGSVQTRIDESIGRKNLGRVLLGLLVVYFLWFPQDASQSNYAKAVFISGFFYAILSASWALLAGIAGQFSFGHMAFMGIGAYAAALLARDGVDIGGVITISGSSIPAVVAILVGAVASGLVGLVVGWLLLRLRSSYLALFTIAFSELFRIVLLTEYDYTGGSNGLSLRGLVVMSDVDVARKYEYYIMFALLVICLGAMYFISNSRIGLFLRAMREDEDAASSLGVNVVLYKVLIFVATSVIIGLAGCVFYSGVGSERIVPEQLEILQMSLVIAYAVVGGMESLLGAAAGAFISRYLLETMREIPLPFTVTWMDDSGMLITRLGIAIAIIAAGLLFDQHERVKGVRWWFRLVYVGLGLVVVSTAGTFTGEWSTFEPGFWRFAIFGIIMVLTLRYMRNGLLYPILQWFEGRDVALRETVSKRDQGNGENGAASEAEDML